MSANPELLRRDRESGRDLFVVEVADPAALAALRAPGGHFTCLLVWDAALVSVEIVARVAEQLLEAGCVYMCAWGPDCERVHDIFDEVIVGDGSQVVDDDAIVMTSWHAAESLEDALWFFLHCANPADRHAHSCRSGIAIVVGEDATWRRTVREALSR